MKTHANVLDDITTVVHAVLLAEGHGHPMLNEGMDMVRDLVERHLKDPNAAMTESGEHMVRAVVHALAPILHK